MQTATRPRRAKIPAQRLFFPAAAIHAALILPLSIAVMTSTLSWPAGLAGGHGYEMLFGFALALVVGYLLGPQPKARLYGVFLLWLAARISYLADPGGVFAGLANMLFALAAAWLIAPKLLAAKKWRNRVISPLVTCLFLLPILYIITTHKPLFHTATLLHIGIVLLSLLMAFMGGRILSAAAAGEFYRRGDNLEARVQPRLEAAFIILLIAAAVLIAFRPAAIPAGLCLIAAGLVTATRLARWRLWRCRQRPDLIALGAGYGWLATGMLFMGVTLITGTGFSHAMHVITIGALGTLSISIAARVHLQSIKAALERQYIFTTATILIALATLSRLLTIAWPASALALIGIAALAWSLAYLLLLKVLLSRPANNSATAPG
ncbi:MAG: NnrS family protein [Gammaproteobacteria bacterium]|nr:NnrS family protein [Gammaproteobacteria bacterium]